jgi:release factor glutamine methyltransferase
VKTVLEILERSADYLRKRGVPEPRLDAEHLLAHALGVQRMDLYLQHDRPLREEELAPVRELLTRRGKREPLSYLLGTHPFAGLELEVGPGALIPRPETEELLEQVLARLPTPPTRVLDLGTGSGALALGLQQAYPQAEVHAVDASGEALARARANARRLALPVHFHQGDWLAPVEGPFDLIVANPPYLTEEEWRSAEPEVREWEPREALVAADEGQADLATLLRTAPPHLAAGGLLALETGIAQHGTLARLAVATASYGEPESVHDLQDRPRFLFLRQN